MNWKDKLLLLRAPEDETGGGDDTGGDVDQVLGGDAPAGKPDDKPAEAPADKPADAPADKPADKQEEQTDEQKAAAEAEAKLNAVPGEEEAYEFALPEGMEIDTTLAEKAQPVLRELGLTRGQANKLAGLMAEVRSAEANAIVDNYVAGQKAYLEAAKKDEEIGGNGWTETVKQSNAALQKFGTPGLTAALREHGMANHPEMIRFMKRVALHTADDTLDKGEHVDTTEVPPESRWYGKTTSTTKKK